MTFMTSEIIAFAAGAALSAVIAAIIALILVRRGRKDNARQSEENTRLREENARLSAELKSTREAGAALLETQEKHHKDAVETLEQKHAEAMEALQKRFDETVAKVSAQMKNATEEMLRQRQQEFSESSNKDLGQIVNPLKETIEAMKKTMNDSTLEHTRMSSEMKAGIDMMMRQSEAARKSADELAKAFKTGSKMQGDWGETVLNELLQAQGLTEGVHYDIQGTVTDASGNTVKTENGRMLRPDVVLHLDARRDVIIDSKVSLRDFVDYANADNEIDRQKALDAHVDNIWKHVLELSAKDYASYVPAPKVKMDYVIMFVPHSGALWTALNARPDMWRKAMDKNVFIADEQTLFAALRIINLTWTQIAQAQNHEKLYGLANEMIDRVGQFMEKYKAVGAALEKAQTVYEDAGRKLAPQGQSILQTAGKLIKLGAKQSDRHPIEALVDIDEIPELEA